MMIAEDPSPGYGHRLLARATTVTSDNRMVSKLKNPHIENLNIRDMSGKIMLLLRNELDKAPEPQNWRAFIALLTKPYHFSQMEVEQFALEVYKSGSPSNQLLLELGGRGMRVCELVQYLLRLRHEKVLIELLAYDPIRICEQPTSLEKNYEGESLMLSVKATGFPFPRYTWFRDSQEVPGGSEEKLRINNLSIRDAGMYCCRLHNSADPKQVVFSDYTEVKVYSRGPVENGVPESKHFRKVPSQEENTDYPEMVKVQSCCNLPVITNHPRDVFIFRGYTILLVCEVTGRGPFRYKWTKNSLYFKEGTVPHLQIDQASPHDSGKYQCCVSNDYGEAWSVPAMVEVASYNQPAYYPGQPPQIIVQPTGHKVQLGETVMFKCYASSNPEPVRYQWLRDAYPISDGDMHHCCQGAQQGQLMVLRAQYDGVYQCEVSNSYGTTYSNKAYLQIVTSIPPTPEQYTAKDKVALLIGNYHYRCENILKAPKSDIQILSEQFRCMDFKVVSLLNLTLTEMNSAVAEFCELLGEGVYGVFYFCGHGFEEKGQCYFVPEDAQTDFSEKDCLSADVVLERMQSKEPKICVMILDICRKSNKNHPPTDHQEMAIVSTPTNHFFGGKKALGNCCICYATCFGLAAFEIGDSGILVKHLQKFMCQPIKIEEVFSRMREAISQDPIVEGKQVPEVRTNIQQTSRSFQDRIYYHGGGTEAFTQRTLAWENAHVKPPSMMINASKQYGIFLELEFQSSFSNVLQVFVTVTDPGQTEDCIAWVSKMPSTVSVNEQPEKVSEGKTKNIIQDIQKLKKNLEITLAVKFRLKGSSKEQQIPVPAIDLNLPLVSRLKLWQPRPALSHSRQPMEQTDENDELVSNLNERMT